MQKQCLDKTTLMKLKKDSRIKECGLKKNRWLISTSEANRPFCDNKNVLYLHHLIQSPHVAI